MYTIVQNIDSRSLWRWFRKIRKQLPPMLQCYNYAHEGVVMISWSRCSHPPTAGMIKRRGSTVHQEVADHAVSDPARGDTILPCPSLTETSSEATTYLTIESCHTHLVNSPEHPLNGCPPSHDVSLYLLHDCVFIYVASNFPFLTVIMVCGITNM